MGSFFVYQHYSVTTILQVVTPISILKNVIFCSSLQYRFSKITPSLFVDKASCTRQFENELSLHSLASLFPIKKGVFSKTYPSFLTVKEGSTSHLGLLSSGEKKETALLGARNRYALRLADHQRSSPCCAGWDRLELPYVEFLLNSNVFPKKEGH